MFIYLYILIYNFKAINHSRTLLHPTESFLPQDALDHALYSVQTIRIDWILNLQCTDLAMQLYLTANSFQIHAHFLKNQKKVS